MRKDTNKKSVAVWLELENGENKGKIALQKRSLENKSFTYVCQATWAGKVDAKESISDAVKRECKEELGEEFFEKFDFSCLKLFCRNKYKIKNEEWEAVSYFGTIDERLLSLVKIHNEALPNFIFVDKKNKISPMSSGKDPENNIVLFDDQYRVWQKILKK